MTMKTPTKTLKQLDELQYATWEVMTPHTGFKINVKGMTVAQEEVLKTSDVSSAGMLSIINQITYECLVNPPEGLSTLSEFERNITVTDRQAILYGILAVTYGEVQDFNITCQSCGHQFDTKADITKNTEIKVYHGKENLIEKKKEFSIPNTNIRAVLHIPTLKDEKDFALSKVPQDILRKADQYIMIKELHLPSTSIDDKTGEPVTTHLIFENVFEIYSHIRKFSGGWRRQILNAWSEEFGNYGVDSQIEATCPKCTFRNTMPINILGEIFRLSQ